MAMSAGRPQVIIPTQMEGRLTADAVVRRGCGRLLVGKESTPQGVVSALKAVITDQALARHAVAVSHEIAARGPQQTVDRIISTCLSVLESCSKTSARIGVA
jgi:UDP:flavonoid glycosyltransferase YjiC (YdhE family)